MPVKNDGWVPWPQYQGWSDFGGGGFRQNSRNQESRAQNHKNDRHNLDPFPKGTLLVFGDSHHGCGYHTCAKNEKPQRPETRWDELKGRSSQRSRVDVPFLLTLGCYDRLSGDCVDLASMAAGSFVEESLILPGVFVCLGCVGLGFTGSAPIASSFRDLSWFFGLDCLSMDVHSRIALLVGVTRVLAPRADGLRSILGSG